jgi:hypothetical protein
MRTLFNNIFGLTVALVMFIVTNNIYGQTGSISTIDINWNDEPNGTLLISNTLDKSLIFFAGKITSHNVIGGIGPMSSRHFDFFDDISMPKGTFILRAISEDVFRQKGLNLSDEDVIYSTLIPFNKDSDETLILSIDNSIDGENVVYFSNNSHLVIILHLDTFAGKEIATLAPFTRKQIVYLKNAPYGYRLVPEYVYWSDDYDYIDSGYLADNPDDDAIFIQPIKPETGKIIPLVEFSSLSEEYNDFKILLINEN